MVTNNTQAKERPVRTTGTPYYKALTCSNTREEGLPPLSPCVCTSDIESSKSYLTKQKRKSQVEVVEKRGERRKRAESVSRNLHTDFSSCETLARTDKLAPRSLVIQFVL